MAGVLATNRFAVTAPGATGDRRIVGAADEPSVTSPLNPAVAGATGTSATASAAGAARATAGAARQVRVVRTAGQTAVAGVVDTGGAVAAFAGADRVAAVAVVLTVPRAATVAVGTGRAIGGAWVGRCLAVVFVADGFGFAAARSARERWIVGAANKTGVAGAAHAAIAGAPFGRTTLTVADPFRQAATRTTG